MSAQDYKSIILKHGVDLDTSLGCVMLDVKPVPIGDHIIPELQQTFGAYDPDKKWVNGFNLGEQHLTLKYGLLQNANVIREDIDALLDGVDLLGDTIYIGSVEVFEQDAPYSCIVGLVETGREGDEDPGAIYTANERLSYLPHIDTFSTYRPHVTLGYVKDEFVDVVLERFGGETLWRRQGLRGTVLEPIGLNYGYPPKEQS